MKKTLLISITLLWSLSSSAQSDKDIVRTISEIKLDSLYVYGDATMATQDQSRELALKLLGDEVGKIQGARIDTLNVLFLQHSRGNMTRTLAYSAIADLFQTKAHAANKSELESKLEGILLFADNITALHLALKDLDHPQCSHSLLDGNTPAQLLEKSYVLVCRGANILFIYSPAGDDHTRRILKTGEKTTRIDYKTGDTIQWIHIDKY